MFIRFNKLKGPIASLAIIGAFILSCTIINVVLLHRADRFERREVTTIPPNFPVVVVVGEESQIVYGSDLNEFTKQHPEYSFLVPSNKYGAFQEQIETNTRAGSNVSSVIYQASFTRVELDSARQRFIVDATWDDDRVNVGEYFATNKDLIPVFHKVYFAPGKILSLFPISLGLTLVFWALFAIATLFWRGQTKATISHFEILPKVWRSDE